MDMVLAFLAGLLFNYWALGIVFLGIAASTHYSNLSLASFLGVIFAVCAVGIFGVPDIKTVLIGLAAYLPIGILWSIWRWNIRCRRLRDKFNENVEIEKGRYKRLDWSCGYDQNRGQQALGDHFKDRVERLKESFLIDVKITSQTNIEYATAWVAFWPFSFAVAILGDIFDFVQKYIVNNMTKIYNKISNKYTSDIIEKD